MVNCPLIVVPAADPILFNGGFSWLKDNSNQEVAIYWRV